MKAGIKTTVLLFSLFFAGKTKAQFYSDMSIGVNGGFYVYQGDLTPSRFGSFRTTQPGISIFAKKPINYFLAIRIHMSFARLVGDESLYSKPDFRQQRNFYFTTPVKEFSAQLVWNIRGRNYDDRGIMPYLFSGAGVSLLRVRKDYSRMNTSIFHGESEVASGLLIDNVHGSPPVVLAVPVGVGVEYPISARFSVNVETSYRFIFTDYLDGFSQSANPKQQDHYHSTSAGIIYKFGDRDKGVGCPTVKL